MGLRGPAKRITGAKPAAEPPDMPADLSPVAAACWKRIVPKLDDAGILTRLDSDVLRLFCESFAAYIEATDHLRAHGLIIETVGSRGQTRSTTNPAWLIRKQAWAEVLRAATALGMTPASRPNVPADDSRLDADADEIVNFVVR